MYADYSNMDEMDLQAEAVTHAQMLEVSFVAISNKAESFLLVNLKMIKVTIKR